MSNIDTRYLELAHRLIESGYYKDTDEISLARKLEETAHKRLKDKEPDPIEDVGDGVQVTVVDSTKAYIYKK